MRVRITEKGEARTPPIKFEVKSMKKPRQPSFDVLG